MPNVLAPAKGLNVLIPRLLEFLSQLQQALEVGTGAGGACPRGCPGGGRT